MSSSSPLAVNAIFVARPGAEGEVLDRLRSLLAPTRAEGGCLRYDLHRSEDDPAVFAMIEEWATRADWERHIRSPHVAEWQSTSGQFVAEASVHALREVS